MKKIAITSIFLFSALLMMGQNQSSTQKTNAMKKVTFTRENVQLVGNLYLPENFDANLKYPSVVVGGSLTSVKEQMAGTYANKLAEQGIIALAFDFSHYGESQGTPRQYEDPEIKLKDLQAAVSFLNDLPYTEGIGALGVCTAGGNVAYLAAEDSRVDAIATVAAWLPNEETLPLLYGSEENLNALRNKGEEAKNAYENEGVTQMVLAYSDTDKTASHFGPMEYYMDQTRGGGVKAWENSFAVMSWETWLDFSPMEKASKIKVPSMIIHSDGSALPDNAKQFYNELSGEKELVWLDGYHFDFYDQEVQVNEAVANASRFFKEKL